VCKSLLRNDYWGKGLGFTQHKSSAYKAYLDLMKRRRAAWNVDDSALELPFDEIEPKTPVPAGVSLQSSEAS